MRLITFLFICCMQISCCFCDTTLADKQEQGSEEKIVEDRHDASQEVVHDNSMYAIHDEYTLFSEPADPCEIISCNNNDVMEVPQQSWWHERLDEVKFCLLMLTIHGMHYAKILKQKTYAYFASLRNVVQNLLGSTVVKY